MQDDSRSPTSLDPPAADRRRAPAPPEMAGEAYDAGGEVHLVDYLKILHRHRWLASTVFLLIVLGAAVYTFTKIPVYRATTRLLIESDEPNVVDFKSVIDDQAAKSDYYTTQYNILQSRSLARKTLDVLKLWDQPPFGGPQPEPKFSVSRALSNGMAWGAAAPPRRGGPGRPPTRPRRSPTPSTSCWAPCR
jgi:uncharacterized protein involved in exopolysaccharide biosynthesis